MRGGGDRDQLARHVEAGLGERVDDVREERRVDLAHVERDRARAGALEQLVDRPRDLVARRELVDEALAVGVEQPRALAADRLGDQEPLAAGDADHRGRVELEELEVRELRAGAVREQHAAARAIPAGWSCATTARRRRRRRSRPRARARRARPRSRPRRSARRRRAARSRARARRPRSAARCAASAESWRTTRRPVALPPECTTRRREWPPSSPSESAPSRSVSKRTPRRSRSCTRSGASAHRTAAAERPHQPAARRARCRPGGARRCRRRRAPPRARPAPSSSRSRRASSPRSARRAPPARPRRARCRAPQRPRRPRRARPGSLGRPAFAGTVQRWRDRIFLSHPASLDHDTGPHPECAARMRRDRAAPRARRLVRLRAPRAPRASTARCSSAATTRGYVAALERLCARGGGHIDADTVVSAGLLGGGAALARAARSPRSTRCCAARSQFAFAAGRPPGHHATRARAMGFCLFNNVALAALHALERPRPRARPDPRLGRPPRQRHQRPLPRDRRGRSTSRSTSRRSIRAPGPAGDRGAGAGRGLHAQPARSRPARATRSSCGWSRERVVPAARDYAPAAGPRLGGLRRARRRSARLLHDDRRRATAR